MATSANRERAVRDEVTLNAIHRETIRKENRCQRLVTEFTINPFHQIHAVTGKPMARHDNQNEIADGMITAEGRPIYILHRLSANFLKIFHHTALEPTKKYTEPQTTSQEIGWITQPLIHIDHSDRRLSHYRQKTEVTAYMEAAWKLKEQSVNLQ